MGCDKRQNLDRQLIVLHGWVDQHHDGRLGEWRSISLLLAQFLIKLEHGEHFFLQRVSSNVKT